MKEKSLLAHSPKNGIPAQTYFEHVTKVRCQAVRNARSVVEYYRGDTEAFVECISDAALYHDLGKVDELNQAVLHTISRSALPIAHEDAGVTELDKLGRREAMVLVHGHHAGLFSVEKDVLSTQGRPFRQLRKSTPNGLRVADHVDGKLLKYEILHESGGFAKLEAVNALKPIHNCGFTRRVALSCLVDADHRDTARHYGGEVDMSPGKPLWAERLAALQRYVYGLPEGKKGREQIRNSLRRRMFEACRDADIDPPIRTCDAPVGSGKTTAVMAHLLNVAARKKPRQLRHIIVVLPYTNIITQSVAVYRKALVLEGERPEDVVAEHHHQADFSNLDLRQLATLWKAPIIVTTAVQFFETLGSHHPARLRKLHELPGSAVFVDEMHAAIPAHLWPQVWRWLQIWTNEWGGHLVLASGSLPRFWELSEYNDLISGDGQTSVPEVPDLVADKALRAELKQTEERRIRYKRRSEDAHALDSCGVVEFVTEKKPGPRLLIVNTVHTAAVIAKAMREMGHDVLHLSTALAPAHRELIVERIKIRLREGMQDWTLVATSCVEAGMDFSFRTGFRERASTASLIQIGGRVSRGDEFGDAEVWDILLVDEQFRQNPAITVSKLALNRFGLDQLNQMHPAELATMAMRREWTSGAEEKARQLIKHEEGMEYPTVSKECRVIDADTRTVIIDRALADTVRMGKRVSRMELMRYSVQIWAKKTRKLALEPIIRDRDPSDSSLYVWNYPYDPDFLGYMEGVLSLDEFNLSGGAII